MTEKEARAAPQSGDGTPPSTSNPKRPRLATVRRDLVEAWGNFLNRFRWHWYVHLTFPFAARPAYAQRSVDTWLASFGETAYAYAAYERGPAGRRLHVHVLLGGIPKASIPLVHRLAQRRWRGGNIKCERFDPQKGACWYVTKEEGKDSDDVADLCSIGFLGEKPMRMKRRKRGKKNKTTNAPKGAPDVG